MGNTLPRWRFGLACSAWMMLHAVPAFAQETPAWKFKQGMSFTLENTHRQKQTVKIDGKVHRSESTTAWITAFEVGKVSGSEVVLDATIVSVTVKEPRLAAMAALAGKLKGSKLRFIVSPAGRVLKMEGYDDLIKKLSDPQRESDHTARWLVSESALRQTLEDMIGFLPDKPGRSWQRKGSESIAPFGALDTVSHYSLAGRRDGAEVLSVAVDASYVLPRNDLGVLHVTKGTLQSARGKGEILFDAHRGLLVRGDKEMHIQGSLTVETAPNQKVLMEFSCDAATTWRLLLR